MLIHAHPEIQRSVTSHRGFPYMVRTIGTSRKLWSCVDIFTLNVLKKFILVFKENFYYTQNGLNGPKTMFLIFFL